MDKFEYMSRPLTTETTAEDAPYFASMMIVKQSDPTPTYSINVVTHQGSKINLSLPIPE